MRNIALALTLALTTITASARTALGETHDESADSLGQASCGLATSQDNADDSQTSLSSQRLTSQTLNSWQHPDSQRPLMADSMPADQPAATLFSTARPALQALTATKASVSRQRQLKPYRFLDDMTFAGVPIFVAGIIAKSEKASFRQDYANEHSRTRLITNFHNEIDNYTQFAPALLAAGLNFIGVEGRSDHWRFLASSAMAYGIMAAIVNPIKHTAKEMRPDGTSRNSWPSGHTATAFVSATILHKEYGLTRSPWYSVAGYAVATGTGVMRVLNNRHWVSDVLSGAGVGILSTELAYGISDLIFKGKHLKRNDLPGSSDIIEHPSFFSLSMGIGLGSRNLEFSAEDLNLQVIGGESKENVKLKFDAATVVGVEGAYFLNKYIGVGGRLRVKSMPIKGWNDMTFAQSDFWNNWASSLKRQGLDTDRLCRTRELTVESNHITEFAADLGVYFNLPLSRRFALGSKLLVGRSIIQDLDINAHFAGETYELIDDKTYAYGFTTPYDVKWDYLSVSGNNTAKFGTGLSLTYAYKHNFSWKVFVDYDFTRKHYTMEYAPAEFSKAAYTPVYDAFIDVYGKGIFTSTTKKNMNSYVLGAAFTVSF